MDFTRARNAALAPKFQGIAKHYRDLGEGLGIRWDYAFYQMLLETNYLQFRRGDGSPGDVSASQNNFAGIGATGGGVPGDRFPDVRTGVLAQLQHLVAYSGERVPDPVAPRTREKQGDIIFLSLKLRRPVTFGDLAKRWAVDPAYARSIETVAGLFRQNYCVSVRLAGAEPPRVTALVQPKPAATQPRLQLAANAAPTANHLGAPLPSNGAAVKSADALPGLVKAPVPVPPCALFTASFGGDVTRLISSRKGAQRRVTALTVSRSSADAETDAFMKVHAPDGQVLGTYDTLQAALKAGETVCPAR